MFIWTISDVAAVIIAVILIGAAIVERISAAGYDKPHKTEQKVEDKPEPRKPKPATRGDKIIYAVSILILVILFFLWRFAHDNGL